MSLKAFIDEVKKGLRSPVYFLYGSDQYILKEASSIAKSSVAEGDRDFLYHCFDLESPDEKPNAGRIIDVLRMQSLLGGRKVVVVENSHKLKDADISEFIRYAESGPSSSAALIVIVKAERGRLKESLKELGSLSKSIPLDFNERDLLAWMRQRASDKGMELSAEAAGHLKEIVGAEAGLLDMEIEKLTLMGKSKITRRDIDESAFGEGDYDAFALCDAIDAKDPSRVFMIYSKIADKVEPQMLIGALNARYAPRALQNPKRYGPVFAVLNEADKLSRSSAGAYPIELLLARLLKL